ncbi:hypothetical protein ScPMuIL_013882 [Solemya velum]
MTLGAIQKDPLFCRAQKPLSPEDIGCFIPMKVLRTHKKELVVQVELGADGGTLLTPNHPENVDRVNIDREQHVYIALYIKFGDVPVLLQECSGGPTIRFHSVCGPNGQLESESRMARLRMPNPWSVCRLDKPLLIGQRISIKIQPLIETTAKVPSRYYVNIGWNCLDYDCSGNNCVSEICKLTKSLNKEDIGEKVEVEIEMTSSKEIKFTLSKEDSSLIGLEGDTKHGLWIYFQLFRTKIEVTYNTPVTCVEGQSQRASRSENVGNDVPDGPFIDPNHVSGNNNAQPMEVSINLKENIRKNYTKLKSDIMLPNILDRLYEDGYLTIEELGKLRKEDKTDDLLEILSKRPIEQSILKNALVKSKHEHLLSLFGLFD